MTQALVQGAVQTESILGDSTSMLVSSVWEEVATYGNEGACGLPVLLGGEFSANRVFVQVAGAGVKIKVDRLREAVYKDGPIRTMLGRYNDFFLMQVSQSIACNGLHQIHQRCCRWLLITLDRMDNDRVDLTHEFLGVMLGVRRSSVTEVLYSLQERGLLSYSRGKITFLDRKRLEARSYECYRRTRDQYDKLMS